MDVYVEDGKVHLLCVSNIDKIGDADRFVIYRTRYPAEVSEDVYNQVAEVSQSISDAFGLKNTPMLVQLITDGKKISVVEFCARTGGGDKFRLIEKVSGFNVVNAVADLTMGSYPHVEKQNKAQQYIVDEFLYCYPGELDHLEGFEELLSDGTLIEYYQLKTKGAQFDSIKSSGDRVAYFTIEAGSLAELRERHIKANQVIKAIDVNGNDILRHDLVAKY